jgi:hypothetical protein
MDLVHATKHLPFPFFLHVSLHFITINNLLQKGQCGIGHIVTLSLYFVGVVWTTS